MNTDISEFVSFMFDDDAQKENKNLKRKRVEDDEGPLAKRSAFMNLMDDVDEDLATTAICDYSSSMNLDAHEFSEGMDGVGDENQPEYAVESPAEPIDPVVNEPACSNPQPSTSRIADPEPTFQNMQPAKEMWHTQQPVQYQQTHHYAALSYSHQPVYQQQLPMQQCQPVHYMPHLQPLHQNMQLQQTQHYADYNEYQPQWTQQAVDYTHPQPTPRQAPLPQRPVSAFFSPASVETQPIASSSAAHPKQPVKKSQEKKTPAFQAPAVAFNDSATMFNINSRLVLTGGRKVTVSVGEIRRRMGAPECQDWRMIAELTRTPITSRAKFQNEMVKHGFTDFDENPDRGLSTISSLLEADALTLAQDFNKIISSDLSRDILCSIAAKAAGEDIQNHIDEIIKHLTCARAYLLCTGRVPDAAGLDMNCPDVRAVRSFSLATHGFGTLAAVSVIDSLTIVIKQLQKSYPTTSTLKRDLSPLTSLPQSDVIIPILEDDLVAFENDVLPRIGYAGTMVTVTRGEMRRRAQGPEKLQCSLLNAFIRKAKVKNTMPILSDKLTKIGVTLTADNRKKAVSVTSWTALTEVEAMAIAQETGEFLSQLPPSEKMRKGVRANPQSAEYLRLVANAICHAMFQIGETPAERKVETAADLQLLRFAMVSHHFGHNFYGSVMQWLHDSL